MYHIDSTTGRRQAILEATLRVIRDSGVHAVTHRAVAAEAGVPLAATTYYFESKDDLLEKALRLVIDETIAHLRRSTLEIEALRPAPTPADVAAHFVRLTMEQLSEQRISVVAQYELYIEAGRRPSLRAAVAAWDEAYEQLAAAALRRAGVAGAEAAATMLVGMLEGLLMGQVALPRPRFEQEVLAPAVGWLVEALVERPVS